MKKRLVILGSTGSIGRSALDIVEKHQDRLEILGLSAHANVELFQEQVSRFKPQYVILTDPEAHARYKSHYLRPESELLPFDEGITTLAGHPDADIILNAIVGGAGLKASLVALSASKRLALANKESMVIGGDLINDIIDNAGGELIPVDSEHSAIFQALRSGTCAEVKKIILTGSGGPFRTRPVSDFEDITLEEALHHPTWKMGPKITIDSATMMNKGLEVIEAVQLFGVDPENIEVVIHPQSIIHSLVEFQDSSVIAQLSQPDMRLPIAYALFFPERVKSGFGEVDLTKVGSLTFEKPDFAKFPLLKLAFEVVKKGGTTPAVFNATNEIAVAAFLGKNIRFLRIAEIVIDCVEKHNPGKAASYEDILEADRWGRETAAKMIGL